jgi:mRNA interferase HigB
MKIIKLARLRAYAKVHPIAAANLEHWVGITKTDNWTNFQDVKCTLNNADTVEVASGRSVVVFNIAGNKFRLITAIHYDMRKVFVLRFLTHAEYSKDKWKNEL